MASISPPSSPKVEPTLMIDDPGPITRNASRQKRKGAFRLMSMTSSSIASSV